MENKFILQEKDDLAFYQIPLFTKSGLVEHAFTTRKGGISEEPFAGLNLALHVGDQKERVLHNRQLLSSALALELENWVAGKQVHGDKVAVITQADRGKGALDYASALEDTDALITNVPGLVLTSYCADCVSILILDLQEKAIGVVHAGWRGTVNSIGVKALNKMKEYYGTNPSYCLVAIGPSIGPQAFEVNRYVLEFWQKSFSYWSQVSKEIGNGKWLIDLWETNRRQFLELGVPPENIVVSSLSTTDSPSLFFSYRAEGGQTGRMAALISLKS